MVGVSVLDEIFRVSGLEWVSGIWVFPRECRILLIFVRSFEVGVLVVLISEVG